MRPTTRRVATTAAVILVLPVGWMRAGEASLATYDRLLSKYVTPAGVCYEAWRASPEDVRALSEIVRSQSAVDPRGMTRADRSALLINLYNASVLRIVLTKAPRRSITEVSPGPSGFGVFRESLATLAGKPISLTDLEARLREVARDPRVHFAINCASRSCPPIAAESYRGSALDAQLDRSVREFLAAPGALLVMRDVAASGKSGVRIACSKIFDWYAADFAEAGGVPAFLQKYAPAEVAAQIRAAGPAATIGYHEYDWSLNRAERCGR